MKKAKFIFCTLTLAAIGLSGCGTQVHTHNLVLHDAVAATCTVDGSVKYWSCDGCKKNFSDAEGKTEITDITVKATGHKYDGQTPSYTWKSDYTECKAEVKCKNCDHKETETASGSKITFTTVSQASCTAKEVRDYKATFTNALFTAQEKKGIEYGELAAHVYDNQERSYVWNSDNTECAAEVKCKNCEHKETEKVSSVATKISDASCTAKAKYKYEATFTNALFAKQVKDNVEVGELADHVYENQERSYVWNNDHTECAAEVQCKNCTHKETETASGAKITDERTAEKTCTTPEIHKYTASFDNALFTTQIVEGVEVGDPAGHDVVTHAAKDPTKTEAGLSTTYYTCNHESDKYFSDNQCTTEISADDVAGYAIKSFDDLDAMLGGATGDNAYDYAKITAAYNYLDGKYSATAKTSYGNGAVLVAKAKYESLYTGPELEVGSKGYYDMYGSRLLNGGDDSTKKYITWKGDFEDTEYGKAYSFKVSSDYEDTDWAGARFSPFNTSADTYVNVFYFYSIGNAKIGLADWNANPFITWDVVEGWNEIVIPNDKIATAHTANQFRLVVKGLKQTNSYYKFTSVFGIKKTEYLNRAIKNVQVKSEYIQDFNKIKTLYGTLSEPEKAAVVGYDALNTAMSSAFSDLLNFNGKKWYTVFGSGLIGQTDTDKSTFMKVGEMKSSIYGDALPFNFTADQTDWAGFRLAGYNKDTTAYAGLFYIYSPVDIEMGLIPWDNAPIAFYTLKTGWNKIVMDNATLTATKGWSGQLRIVFDKPSASTDQFLMTSVYGLSQRQYVVETIDSVDGAEAYSITKAKAIKTAYDGLTQADKTGIDATKLNAFVAKYYEAVKANIYPSSNYPFTYTRTTIGDVGLVYKVVASSGGITSSNAIIKMDLTAAQTGSIDETEHTKGDNTLCFYTYGLNVDGKTASNRMIIKNGSTILAGGVDHVVLENGWVKNTITVSRTSNFWANLDKTQPLYIFFDDVAQDTTFYISSFFGVHA